MKQRKHVAPHRAQSGEAKEGDDYLSMRLSTEDRARLKRIIREMLEEPDLRKGESIGYAGAARYAFRRCIESMPVKEA